jgi:glutathione peroxidase
MDASKLTGRQKVLRFFYPLLLLSGKFRKRNLKGKNLTPPVPFHSLSVPLNNGSTLLFEHLRGKKVLLVNTASNCGYTNQYEALQELYTRSAHKLEIIGFPANDFKEQEKGTDEEISQFCRVNFGVTFPLARKSVVVPGPLQNPVFNWLTKKEKNGWNEKPPEWNFSKYLLDEEGKLLYYFAPSVSPLDPGILKEIGIK